jgi:hypothetical protein
MATTALTHAANARGRGAEPAIARARQAVEDARAALQKTRRAITMATARSGSGGGPSPSPAAEATVEGQAEATCPACGLALVVRYRTATAGPVVAFPVACPDAGCDGVSLVAYPSTAVEVTVTPAA